MGTPKALLAVPGGRTFVRALVDALVEGGCAPVVVVLGPSGERVLEAAGDLAPAVLAFNRDGRTDMIDSVRLGERYLPAAVDVVAVTPVDAPFATPALVRTLAQAAAAGADHAAVPVAGGRRGHPVVLPRAALWNRAADGGLRALLASGTLHVVEVPWEDARVTVDLNTPEDLSVHLPDANRREPHGG